MTGATFGRKATADGAAMAARRAAFIAAERARAGRPPEGAAAAEPVFVRERTLGTAYLLWFFLGGLSAHRFYLGFPVSAAIQAGLMPVSYALLIAGSLAGLLTMAGTGLWLLADAFLIPGLVRAANAKARRVAVDSVFA